MTLMEQWRKGELEEYKRYYCRTRWGEDIFKAHCYNKHEKNEWWVLENEKYEYNNIYHAKDIEVLAPVPSYEEWKKIKEQREACAWALDKIGDVLVNHKLVKLKELFDVKN